MIIILIKSKRLWWLNHFLLGHPSNSSKIGKEKKRLSVKTSNCTLINSNRQKKKKIFRLLYLQLLSYDKTVEAKQLRETGCLKAFYFFTCFKQNIFIIIFLTVLTRWQLSYPLIFFYYVKYINNKTILFNIVSFLFSTSFFSDV